MTIEYPNLSQNSGISEVTIATDAVDVKFTSGSVYRYTRKSVGSANLATMKALAIAGKGLNGFINKVVRNLYSDYFTDFPTDLSPNPVM